eukprot:GFUD01009786.1.p1 GENE.GFUD01009786.1~~GFUD01009786.1.p1  ORF type:complete len:165 (-),score=56.72 GFUD01009786.1:72-566(-)
MSSVYSRHAILSYLVANGFDPGMPGMRSRADILFRLPSYNSLNGCKLVGRPVLGNHRKNCTKCYQSFHGFGEWYWTDAVVPWGADKYCDRCMAEEVGADFEEDEEMFEEDSDDEEDYSEEGEEDDSEEDEEKKVAIDGNGSGVGEEAEEESETNSGQKKRKLGE